MKRKYAVTMLESNNKFYYREDSEGDKGVIFQMFEDKDYEVYMYNQGQKLINYYHEGSKNHKFLIIDAGANIGASTVYFSQTYPNSLIFSIEPDVNNYQLLEVNSKKLDVFCFNGAISNEDGELVFVDPGISDWSFMTRPVLESDTLAPKVKSISPPSILSHPACKDTVPLILKIDIEGGEEVLFEGDTSWLNKFPLVIIELHDWMLPFAGTSRNFIKAVAKYDFDILHRGENIFLFNREILNS